MEVDTNDDGAKQDINKEILFRDSEIEFLTRFMGPDSSIPYPSLFIYGHTATGKTYVLSKLLKKTCVPFVWVDCNEASTPTSLFMKVVHDLSALPDDERKVTNVCEFVNYLKLKLNDRKDTTYLVFDSAEVFRKEDPFLLPVLCQLQGLTRVNVCSIFISELPWIKFITPYTTSFNPISLHFSNYTKNQIAEILRYDCPKDFDESFHDGYINVIMKTFFTVTRNLSELRHLAHVNFEKYCEPLDEDFEPTVLQLFKNIEPTLKEAMSSVYLREVSGSKWKIHCKNINQSLGKEIASSKFCATRELPFYSKFLLIAAYFASYNPPKTDFKHFVKNQGKQGKKRITKKAEKNRHLLGPKPFSLDRMLSIFFTIVGERVLPSALIFSQISSLVNMRLMSRVSADEQLDCPKYKCLAELDLVSKIGKTVSIDIMGYLDDFIRNI